MPEQRCPSCQRSLPESAFQCPDCELLLVGDLGSIAPPSQGGSLVRGLLERPQAQRLAGLPTPPPIASGVDLATRPMKALPRMDHVPEVVGALTSGLDLTPFEAFVASRIDGSTTAADLTSLLGLTDLEVGVVLQNLVEKRLVRLKAPPARPARAAPPSTPLVAPAPAPVHVPPAPELRPLVGAPPTPRASEPERGRLRGAWGNLFLRPEAKPPEPAPAPAEGALQRALRLEQAGKLEEAVRLLDQAIAQSPDAARLYNRLAIVLVMERKDFREAERLLRKAVALAPDDPIYQRNLYALLARQA